MLFEVGFCLVFQTLLLFSKCILNESLITIVIINIDILRNNANTKTSHDNDYDTNQTIKLPLQMDHGIQLFKTQLIYVRR